MDGSTSATDGRTFGMERGSKFENVQLNAHRHAQTDECVRTLIYRMIYGEGGGETTGRWSI